MVKPGNLNPQGYITPDGPDPSPFWGDGTLAGHGLPPGGAVGESLVKTGADDYAAGWTPRPGLGDVAAEAETGEMGTPAEAHVRATPREDGNIDLTFHFEIPEGMEGPPGPAGPAGPAGAGGGFQHAHIANSETKAQIGLKISWNHADGLVNFTLQFTIPATAVTGGINDIDIIMSDFVLQISDNAGNSKYFGGCVTAIKPPAVQVPLATNTFTTAFFTNPSSSPLYASNLLEIDPTKTISAIVAPTRWDVNGSFKFSDYTPSNIKVVSHRTVWFFGGVS